MSKLFDQLKDAARSREAQPPSSEQGGLLGEALRKSRSHPRRRVPNDQRVPNDPPPPPPRLPNLRSPAIALALAGVIFLFVTLSWYSNPWSAPPKKAWPGSGLKLDTKLDLKRTERGQPGSK